MEDRKIVTDEQIIKALECCQTGCKECPFKKYQEECAIELNKRTIELVKRQKAEVERLQKECDSKEKAYNEEYCLRKELKSENEKKNTEIDILIEKKDTLQDENSELMAEIERLKNENLKLFHKMHLMRAEAIRDGAVKLPELIPNINGETTMEAVERAIKHLVKEMVGDENEKDSSI